MASLDEILDGRELTRSDLEFDCPRKTRDMVAEEIVDEWYLTGRALNVSESKLKSIKSDSRLSGPEEKAVATMDAWADENGEQATILKLVEALYRRKKRSRMIIDSICREVQRDRPTSAASARDTSSYHGHQTSDTNQKQKYQDQPKFSEKDRKQIITTKSPMTTSAKYRGYFERYTSQVTILLHTVKDEEMLAACSLMSSPLEGGDTDRPVRWFVENISLTLGIFADHKAALIQTHKGTDCRHSLLLSLQHLQNVKLIIGLGFAYGRRNKSELGDVLVSTCVDGVSNFRIEDGQISFDEGLIRYTNPSIATYNVFATGASLWTDFKCSTSDRESKALPGVIISTPVLLNDRKALADFLMNNKRFIGGEMEGQELAHAQRQLQEKEKRHVDFVVIKGVADFGDGTKEKDWQLTASLAAASYAEHKLLQTGGSVYFVSDSATRAVVQQIGRAEDATDVPYCLQIIPSRVEKCYGCNRKFRPRKKKLTPPDDLVVSHKERRLYPGKSGALVQAPTISNVYFHLAIGCIQPTNSSFKLSCLKISDSNRAKLVDAHKSKLQELGLTVD